MAGRWGLIPLRGNGNMDDSDVRVALVLVKNPEDFRIGRVGDAFKGDTKFKQGFWVPTPGFVKSMMILAGIATMLGVLLVIGSETIFGRANHLGRLCLDGKPKGERNSRNSKFAMVTCTDGASSIPGRSFEGLMELVTPNKRSYAERHGYDFVDASYLIDKSRPPSWSKIISVRQHLANYDWVFWNDADSVVTNPTIALVRTLKHFELKREPYIRAFLDDGEMHQNSLSQLLLRFELNLFYFPFQEDIVHSVVGDTKFEEMPSFLVTEDVTGVNAGMFFLRNSDWSLQFLDLWWNQTSFIRPFGECKSGDNDALKFLMKTMPKEEHYQHVRIPKMQCAFNSNLWNPSFKSIHRLMAFPRTVWRGVYGKGDFMVHLAGLDDKKRWIKKILNNIQDGY